MLKYESILLFNRNQYHCILWILQTENSMNIDIWSMVYENGYKNKYGKKLPEKYFVKEIVLVHIITVLCYWKHL